MPYFTSLIAFGSAMCTMFFETRINEKEPPVMISRHFQTLTLVALTTIAAIFLTGCKCEVCEFANDCGYAEGDTIHDPCPQNCTNCPSVPDIANSVGINERCVKPNRLGNGCKSCQKISATPVSTCRRADPFSPCSGSCTYTV